jgi:hypothetical protein
MFHHRSVGFTGDSKAQNGNLLSSGRHQNENLIHRGNQLKSSLAANKNSYSGTKVMGASKLNNSSRTPSEKKASTRRRAFGDISNKKANDGLAQKSNTAKRNPQQIDVLKPRSSNLLPKATRSVPTTQTTRFAILPEKPKPSLIEGDIDQAANSKQKTVGQQGSFARNLESSIAITEGKSHTSELVPDVERPAGRTWKQQLEYDLKSEDDAASISSIESDFDLENYFSPQDTWRKERDNIWKRQKEKDDEEDRQVLERIQAIIDREQEETEEGLDSLYDAIDNLEIFSDSSLVDERNDRQGENWNAPDLTGFDLNLSADLSLPP